MDARWYNYATSQMPESIRPARIRPLTKPHLFRAASSTCAIYRRYSVGYGFRLYLKALGLNNTRRWPAPTFPIRTVNRSQSPGQVYSSPSDIAFVAAGISFLSFVILIRGCPIVFFFAFSSSPFPSVVTFLLLSLFNLQAKNIPGYGLTLLPALPVFSLSFISTRRSTCAQSDGLFSSTPSIY